MLTRPPAAPVGAIDVAHDARWSALAARLSQHRHLVLAVSGGADSLAMLVGICALQSAELVGCSLLAVTVDHGLRAEAADEAAHVGHICSILGVPHRTVTLRGPMQPGSLQAWARTARYRALASIACAQHGVILTAHTADDQAETLLMRAVRGTGSDGLAGIRAQVQLAGVQVERPFLDWPRAQLHDVLQGSGLQPVEDPSNSDPRFTRVRFRQWLAQAPAGDGERSLVAGLAQSARIAALESEALERMAQVLLAEVGGAARGFVLGQGALRHLPVAITARFIALAMRAVARHREAMVRLDLARLVGVAQRMAVEPSGAWTCAGAVFVWHEDATSDGRCHVMAFSEAGRSGFPVVEVAGRSRVLWDGRFEVINEGDAPVLVRAIEPQDDHCELLLSKIIGEGGAPSGYVTRLLQSLPIAVEGARIVANPLAGGDLNEQRVRLVAVWRGSRP